MTETTGLINGLANIDNVKRLLEMMERLQGRHHLLHGMGCLHGRAGLGKTSAAIVATNIYNAVHIEARKVGGQLGLVKRIAFECGLKPLRNTDAILGQVTEYLARSGRPLIVDEADNILTNSCIEIVRYIHDDAQAAVILIGEEQLPMRLQAWERVASRVLSFIGMEDASLADVDHLAGIYAKGVTLAPDLKAALLAASRGSIRHVSSNLSHVREYATVKGLAKVDLSTWGSQPFHTGEPPTPRSAPMAIRRKGAAA